MKVLVLGASGLIGSAMYKTLYADKNIEAYGGLRNLRIQKHFSSPLQDNLVDCGDLLLEKSISSLLKKVNPEVVINCVGLTKHKKNADDPSVAMPINAFMPHEFALACNDRNIRLIHISSDCVFSGSKGGYVEGDAPDAIDIYGRSKAMGEVIDGNALTLRTSTIGHELGTSHGLLEWFLSQNRECFGFSKAIFSGLPSVVFAEIIKDFVLPNLSLKGLYHVSAEPINKYDLLKLIAKIYGKKIEIKEDRQLILDRSLSCEKFKAETGYKPIVWSKLIEVMYKNHLAESNYV